MENKTHLFKHQATGWDHFRSRDLSKKINPTAVEKKENKLFAWIMKTLNPINHIPIVGTIKNINSKAEKSLDIIQSAVGGMIYGGPYGFIKGIGGWVASKIFTKDVKVSKIMNKQTMEPENNNTLKEAINIKEKKPLESNIIKDQIIKRDTEVKSIITKKADFTVSKKDLIINDRVSNNHNFKRVLELYSNKTDIKNKNININA